MSKGLAKVLAEGVREHGAEVVFGMPGGGPNLDVVGAAGEAGLRFVLAHGEMAACMMAGTFGLLTGRPGLAIATRGPGAACATNGAAQATLDRFPLLLVTDCVPGVDRDRFAHQRFDQQQLFAPVTKWSGRLIDSPRAVDVVRGALALAAARPAGAVHLDYDPRGCEIDLPASAAPVQSADDIVERAAELLRRAANPVAIVGLEAVGSAGQVLAVLERLGCPVLTTYQALGVVPEGHPQQAGLFTSGAIEAAIIGECDLVLAVGLDQVEPMPSPWRYDVPVVSVSEVAACATLVPISIEVLGPLASTLHRVVGTSTGAWPTGSGAAALAKARVALAATSTGNFGPLELAAAVAAATPAQATATVDAGAHFLAVMPFWRAATPLRLLISNGLATMGFALPAAIGAALARPGSPVVCMVGDGGLAMTLAELETLARLQLPVTVVVFDDAALSLIEVKQRSGQGGQEAVRFGPVDYAQVASAMGLDSAVVTTTAGARAVLAGGWDRPRLIDARIDPSTYAPLIAVTRG
ncbi:MAG TPA: thiamine pyrophosphate-binding protein [Ilumatobacteraceae bacterium]|nr:thiamine pyrophosphate-binding protein [Ilumatobacteraceae bacterium]